MHIKRRTTCRVCGNTNLICVLNLGELYLQGSFVKGDLQPSLRKVPIELVLCNVEQDENACGLLQLRHSVPQAILYKNYWYRSGTNSTMRNHLRDINKMVAPYARNSILDIGCNDGTLLKFFDIKTRIGVDPSNIAGEVQNGIKIINTTFPCDLGDMRFDAITSIAMFYDLESPVGFAREIKKYLKHRGVWCFEVAYLPSILKNNAFDSICSEHIEYYSMAVIENILSRAGMKLIKAEINSVNCGSLLCLAVDKFSDYPEDKAALDKIRENEFSLCLDEVSTYFEFDRAIGITLVEIEEFIAEEYKSGKKIHIYGASTKGNILIQATGISTYLSYAADRNESKWGAYTLGTNIPIISEEESRRMSPDYYLVLPWQFKEEFIQREKMAWMGSVKKPKLIFPLPRLEVVSLD